jgi:hypothetical protein
MLKAQFRSRENVWIWIPSLQWRDKKNLIKCLQKRVSKMLKQANKVVEPLFPHQVISMWAIERGLGIFTKSTMPQTFNQLVDLGNASHVDVMDG